MKSLLLVLTVIRNAETRSAVRSKLEDLGHRVIDASGHSQAHSLLSNGLGPDLFVLELPAANSGDAANFRQLIRGAGAVPTCAVVASDAARAESNAAGIKHVLLMPAGLDKLETLLDAMTHADVTGERPVGAGRGKASLMAGAASDESPTPLMEELGDGGYFLAASPRMREIHRQALLIAEADVNVLILGESGTGKEVVAHLIHKHSQRAGNRFLKVNCAALPADLLESEMFGHQKGAFTGAIKDRPGKFEQANHGTILLDEIGEMSAQMQAKLLHVLQDGQFARLGGQESIQADLRILAATNIQMESALEEKKFREDLYYRLSVFTISIPPLRERREEIPFLIEETIRRAPAEMLHGNATSFAARLMDSAVLYDWRGNLRELRNFVTRTLIMRDPDAAVRELEDKIDLAKQPSPEVEQEALQSHRSGMRSIMREMKDRAEAQLIQDALEVSGWNRRHAAQYLNISYRGLLYKIQQHRLTPRLPRQTAQASRTARLTGGKAN